MYVTQWTDKSLALFTPTEFEALAKRMSEKSPTKDVRNYMRLFYARADRVDLDKQGRVRVPDRLRGFAELGRDVVLLGVSDHAEIWDSTRWENYVSELNPQFDEISEHAYG
jgi:MraZ protein